MTDNEVLQLHIPLVSFIAEVCGPQCEVVLHDVSNPEKSVIAIKNSMTDRTIDSPMTDLSLEIQSSGKYKTQDYLSNYNGISKNKPFLSSTYFIKNGSNLVGLLCINRDITLIQNAMESLNIMAKGYNLLLHHPDNLQENLENPIENMFKALISDAIAQTAISPERMSMSEKVDLVHQLNEQGILRMKGAVSEIAYQLKTSEPTIYRYLNTKIRE